MELRHLRYFVGVATDGAFSRAAQRLRVAQPALSRQIRQLEEEIGVSLLERTRSGVRLTAAGTAFLEEARDILERSESAVHAARTHEKPAPAVLHLAYVWGLFHSTAPILIGGFRRDHPDVAVHLLDLTATQQTEALQSGRIDAGFIGFAQEARAAGLASCVVGSCRFQLALPTRHPAARRARVNLAALSRELFVVISEETYPGAAQAIRETCAEAGFSPRILQSVERGHTMLSLVSAGCGVALLPETLGALPHPGVVLRPVRGAQRIPLHVAWNPSRPNPHRDAFLRTLGVTDSQPRNAS